MRILLADDHKLIRDAIKAYFEDDPQYDIVAEVSNGIDGLRKIEKSNPEVVLTDINMPEMDGITFTKEIKKKDAGIKVIIITMYDDYKNIKRAMSSGADGYILKDCGEEEIKKAISSVMKRKIYSDEEVTKVTMARLSGKTRHSRRVAMEMPLSPRETEVLRLIIKEYSNQEMSEELFI